MSMIIVVKLAKTTQLVGPRGTPSRASDNRAKRYAGFTEN
jgi:hypothetical protein